MAKPCVVEPVGERAGHVRVQGDRLVGPDGALVHDRDRRRRCSRVRRSRSERLEAAAPAPRAAEAAAAAARQPLALVVVVEAPPSRSRAAGDDPRRGGGVERLEPRVGRDLDARARLDRQDPGELRGRARVLDLIPEHRLRRGDRERHPVPGDHGGLGLVLGVEAAAARARVRRSERERAERRGAGDELVRAKVHVMSPFPVGSRRWQGCEERGRRSNLRASINDAGKAEKPKATLLRGRRRGRLPSSRPHRACRHRSYKEGDSDIGAQLKRMKAEDLKKYGLAVPVDPTKVGGKFTKLDKKILYTPGFDAVFIPGRAADVGLIAAQLNFHDMKVPFLGGNGWNAPDIARTADQSIDGAVFVDGFFAESPNPNVQDFVDRYKKRFQTLPTLFAMQGYDAVRFVIEAIKKGATSGETIRDYLTSQQDLPALGGPAAFAQDGTLNRPVFLIQVKRGRFTQVD